MSQGLCKRIIPCLDVDNGVTVKGINFGNLRKIGDPVELALRYQEQGADEIKFPDISASRDNRATLINLSGTSSGQPLYTIHRWWWHLLAR